MAVVSDEFTAVQTRTVFTKPPDEARQYTALPRAMVNFTVNAGVVSAKPINDTQELEIHINLDDKFAYRIVDLAVDVVQDVAQGWTARGYLEVTDKVRNLPAGSRQRFPVTLDDAFRTPTPVQMWLARSVQPVTYIFQALPGGPVVNDVDFHATNQSAPAGAAGVVNALFTFFEYEIEQAEYVALHYATLTYQR